MASYIEREVIRSQKLFRLEGKLAVITASTAGIGLAIAKRFVDEGAYVVISSRYPSHVEQALNLLGNHVRVKGITCDVASAEQRQKLLSFAVTEFSGKTKIDILVSNAACSPYVGSTLSTPPDAFDKLFDVNVKATFYLICEAAATYLQDGSSILVVSSVAAFDPAPPIGVYGITKTALLGLTKAFAHELAWRNIRVNCLAPGIVKTRFSSVLWKTPEAMEFSANRAFLNRVAECDEIAGPACFLCSSDASFITGECLLAAGGVNSRL